MAVCGGSCLAEWGWWRRLPLLGLLTAFPVAVFAVGPVGVVRLSQLRNHARPLLIFAPAADDARLMEQVRTLKDHAAEAAERDLVVVTVAERGESSGSGRLDAGEVEKARMRFHVTSGEFAVVLVGNDGGEKLRSASPLSFEKLREVIDAMPMRRAEMKREPR